MQRAGQDDSFGVTREMAYDGDMDDITESADALRGLRQLLHRLKSEPTGLAFGSRIPLRGCGRLVWPLDCSFLLDPLIKLSRPRRAHAVITATLVVSAFYL